MVTLPAWSSLRLPLTPPPVVERPASPPPVPDSGDSPAPAFSASFTPSLVVDSPDVPEAQREALAAASAGGGGPATAEQAAGATVSRPAYAPESETLSPLVGALLAPRRLLEEEASPAAAAQ